MRPALFRPAALAAFFFASLMVSVSLAQSLGTYRYGIGAASVDAAGRYYAVGQDADDETSPRLWLVDARDGSRQVLEKTRPHDPLSGIDDGLFLGFLTESPAPGGGFQLDFWSIDPVSSPTLITTSRPSHQFGSVESVGLGLVTYFTDDAWWRASLNGSSAPQRLADWPRDGGGAEDDVVLGARAGGHPVVLRFERNESLVVIDRVKATTTTLPFTAFSTGESVDFHTLPAFQEGDRRLFFTIKDRDGTGASLFLLDLETEHVTEVFRDADSVNLFPRELLDNSTRVAINNTPSGENTEVVVADLDDLDSRVAFQTASANSVRYLFDIGDQMVLLADGAVFAQDYFGQEPRRELPRPANTTAREIHLFPSALVAILGTGSSGEPDTLVFCDREALDLRSTLGANPLIEPPLHRFVSSAQLPDPRYGLLTAGDDVIATHLIDTRAGTYVLTLPGPEILGRPDYSSLVVLATSTEGYEEHGNFTYFLTRIELPIELGTGWLLGG